MKYVVALLALLIFQPLAASHYQQTSFSYESLGPNTVRVHLWSYQECTTTGNMPGTTISYTITQSSSLPGCVLASSSAAVALPSVDVTPICPAIQSTCDNLSNQLYGISESHNYQDFDFTNATCPDYTFSYSTCCRNPSLGNIVSPSSGGFYGYITLYPGAIGQGSLPAWHYYTPRFVQLPQSGSDTLMFDLGLANPNNDSVVYAFDAPYTGPGAQVTFNVGYSVNSPMGSNYGLSLDPEKGWLQFVMSSTSPSIVALIGFKTQHYRNGQLIAETNREFNLATFPNGGTAWPGQPAAYPIHLGLQSVSNGYITGDTAVIPPNSTTQIGYGFNSSAPVLTGEARGYYFGKGTYDFKAGGVSTNPYFGNGSGQVFEFTPPATGVYEFWVGLKDSICRFPALEFKKYTVVVGDTSLVWPGDANNDLVANNVDVLAVGLGANSMGPVRANASNTWIGQPSLPWTDTIAGAIDKKFVDCDGNGVIDSLDLLPITLNYGLTHLKTSGANGTHTDPPLTLTFAADSFQVGDTVEVQIDLGDVNIQAQNVYGIAFSILYDNALIDTNSFALDFDNSWIGSGMDVYDFQMDLWDNGRMDGAIVRNDGTAMSGMGHIAKATFVIIDNIDGKRHTIISDTLELMFADVHVINAQGELIPVNASGDDAIVFESITDLVVPTETPLSIYPNPTRDLLRLRSEYGSIEHIEVVDIQGRKVLTFYPQQSDCFVSLRDLRAGLYYLRVERESGTSIHKVVKK